MSFAFLKVLIADSILLLLLFLVILLFNTNNRFITVIEIRNTINLIFIS